MERISSSEFAKLKSKSEDEVALIQCQTNPREGTSCKVDGKRIDGGIVEAVEEGKKVSENKEAKAYFQNASFSTFWPLEEFIESCPRLSQEIELNRKIKLIKISAILLSGIAILAYLWFSI